MIKLGRPYIPNATYQVPRSSAFWFWRRIFLKDFYQIWAWRPSWSCDDPRHKIWKLWLQLHWIAWLTCADPVVCVLGGGGGGQNMVENSFVTFFIIRFNVLNLFYSGVNCQFQRKLYFLVSEGAQHFPGVGVELNCLFPINRLVIFNVSPGHLSPFPPTSSLDPCMTDPPQNDRRFSGLNHE